MKKLGLSVTMSHGPRRHANSQLQLVQKGPLGAPGFAPAHAVADRGVTRGHRLTVHADLLLQASGDARLRIRELDALGPNPAAATDDAALPINERHGMRRPRQI